MKVASASARRKSPARKKAAARAAAEIFPGGRRWQIGLTAAILAAALLLACRLIDLEAVHDHAQRLNAGAAFALLAVLPLIGFPVNVLHVAAGIRFGFVLGMTLVALSILLQLLTSFALVRLFPQLFARRLQWVREKIPPAAHGTLCVFTLLLPGVPFVVQNYALPLVGVPFRTYVSRCWPMHTLRAVLTVGLGQQSGHFTPTGLAALAAYWLLVLGASWWAYRRLRRQLGDRPAAAGDRMQPA